jgi:hypothetical protein
MQRSPELTVSEFANVDPGTLGIVQVDSGRYVGLIVIEPVSSRKYVVVFGSPYQGGPFWEVVTQNASSPVLCFPDYRLCLPCGAGDWCFGPQSSGPWLVLCEGKPYALAKFNAAVQAAFHVYVDLAVGELVVDRRGNFTQPTGSSIYTASFTLCTNESQPREIIRFPAASSTP